MNFQYIRNKSQYDALSEMNKARVFDFLTDEYTENNVQIKLHDDGLITFRDYSDTEFDEMFNQDGFIDKDVLLYILTDETTISMKAKKDLQVGAIYKYSVTGTPYRIVENDGSSITLRMVTEHNVIMQSAEEVKLPIYVWNEKYHHNMTRCEHLMGADFYKGDSK